MKKTILEIYREEINNIIDNDNVTEIFLVGSSKYENFESSKTKINDIDIFIFRDNDIKQERIIKTVNGIDFDINYFSYEGVESFIKDKEYFFLKEMNEPKIVYNKNNKAQQIIDLCKKVYIEGPNKLSYEEKEELRLDILSKIDSLKNKSKYSQFELLFLTNIYLKDIIVSYFKLNNKWIPKDKKLLKTLEDENKILFNIISEVKDNYKYESLIDAYKYIFKIKTNQGG